MDGQPDPRGALPGYQQRERERLAHLELLNSIRADVPDFTIGDSRDGLAVEVTGGPSVTVAVTGWDCGHTQSQLLGPWETLALGVHLVRLAERTLLEKLDGQPS